jgi:hypothetical protein
MEGKMKTRNIIILSLVIMIGFALSHNLSHNLYAAEPLQVAADHLSMVKNYADKAAEQSAIIAEHQQMKLDYKKRYYINEKLTPSARMKEMEDHCDAIIHHAQMLRDEFLEFAKWHKMRAAELQGK